MEAITRQTALLAQLGKRLRSARLERGDRMEVFAARIGASESTLRAMEKGSAKVQVGFWLEAFWILDRLDEIEALLAPRASILDEARAARTRPRQRAPRRPRQ